ncbi:hypothetical protein OE88DRAFT_949540 [Heliocybe sulcata]|uniref:Uncharacterized protein n=1 Tax=Heliocybe sulcata TaxID=5364 RepID=A0A5C3NM64_9AGAM|nr:hypothetical protein OE88DRAFT_949540 [Heliocybe sulcata]
MHSPYRPLCARVLSYMPSVHHRRPRSHHGRGLFLIRPLAYILPICSVAFCPWMQRSFLFSFLSGLETTIVAFNPLYNGLPRRSGILHLSIITAVSRLERR